MAHEPPAEDLVEDLGSTPGEEGEPLDLAALLAAHHGLRRDLRRFVDHVDRTPVTDREAWAALASSWELFAVLVRRCFRWERLHLWPSVAAGEQDRGQVASTLALAQGRADAIESMIESSRAVFERLALARDEDAVATLRARVRAACSALEEGLDGDPHDVMPLTPRHIPAPSAGRNDSPDQERIHR